MVNIKYASKEEAKLALTQHKKNWVIKYGIDKYKKLSKEEFIVRAEIIDAICNGCIKDYGMNHFLYILSETNKRLGTTLVPLNIKLLKKLHNAGCNIKINKMV